MYVKKSSPQRFCSTKCQHEWQKTRTGINNPRCTKQIAKCEWCGKDYLLSKYKIDNGQHHFCSQDCRKNWYAKIWSQTDEWRDESRKRATEILSNNKAITMTKPQIIVNHILDEMGIQYRNEEPFVYYSIDNYLPEYNLAIEVMGDYWHCSPLKYTEPKNDAQARAVSRDKAKRTYLAKYNNINILYLWENDIETHPDICKSLIYKYITSCGALDNYNSFNYHLECDVLAMNHSIIVPFQELQKSAS